MLRDGGPYQRQEARRVLAELFERRGQLAEATELLETNVREGERSTALYTRLALLYRRQGLIELADEALTEAARSRPAPAPPSPLAEGEVLDEPLDPFTLHWAARNQRRRGSAARRRRSPLTPVAAVLLLIALLLAAVGAFALRNALASRAEEVPARWTPPALSDSPSLLAALPECPTADRLAKLRPADGPESPGICPEDELVEEALFGRRVTREIALAEPPLPGALLPVYRVVAYYGNPLAPRMGILGELPPEQLLDRLRQRAESYQRADPDRPVMPALHLVSAVAQADPGPGGAHLIRTDPAIVEEISRLAESRGYQLVLDLQIGRSTVAAEVQAAEPFLRRPHVHLALDPEFAVPAGRAPGQVIGSLDAGAVNGAIRTLDALVTAHDLPPKLLIVHRFTEGMLKSSTSIRPTPRVQVVIDMDGFGPPGAKAALYREFVFRQGVQFAGIKLFHLHDEPVMSPREVLSLDPPPDVVIYQ